MSEQMIIEGHPFRLVSGNTVDSLKAEFGVSEEYFRTNIPNNGLVINIGAGIGVFAIRSALEYGCLVWAYESRDAEYEALCYNIAQNNVQDLVKPFKKTVSVASTSEDVISLGEVFENNLLARCDVLKLGSNCNDSFILGSHNEKYLRATIYVVLEDEVSKGYQYREVLKSCGFLIYDDRDFLYIDGMIYASNGNVQYLKEDEL